MTVTVTGLKTKPNTEVFNLSLLLKSTEKKMSPKCSSSKQLKNSIWTSNNWLESY